MGESSDAEQVDWFGVPPAALVRATLGLLLAALVSVFGALILGEYEFRGWLPLVAGVLFGLVVAEVVVGVGRRRTWPTGVAAGLLAGGGLVWAGWISASEGLEPMPTGAWVAAGLAFVVAAGRVVVGRAD